MKTVFYKWAFIFVLLQVSLYCKADWPIGKGRSTLIASYNYYHTNKNFNRQGKIENFAQGDRFISHFSSLSFIHGISRRLDMNVSVPFIAQDLITSGIQQKSSDLGDIVLGLSYHFPSEEFKKHFTIKAAVIVPGYSNDKQPAIGYGSKGIQAAINYSFSPFKDAFSVIESSYTRFLDFEDGPDQYRQSATLGVALNKYSLVTFSFAHQISQSINTNFNPNPQATKNFNSGTLTATYGRKLTRTISPYIQGFYTLYGNNVGQGIGASFFVIIKIP
jgi:protein XagA